jgi:hypothetical protein
MTDFKTKNSILLDGTVGNPTNLYKNSDTTGSVSRIQVFVSGIGSSNPNAKGLDEDLRLVVQSFIRDSRSSNRETASKGSVSDAQGAIKIALHGLNLSPKEEQELHHLIREVVRKRVAGKGGKK